MAQLKALLSALQASDMVSMELHAKLRQEAGDDLAEVLQPLDQAMADLEFEAATIECEKLVRQFEPATIETTV